jgi:hypothetical protein
MSAGAILLGLVTLAASATPSPPSDHAEAAEWAVRMERAEHHPGAAGGPAVVRIHVTSRAGYHLNMEYPVGFIPAPECTAFPERGRIPLRPSSTRPCQGHPDESCSMTLDLPGIAPEKAGARVAGTLAFSVCSSESCLINKVALLLTHAGGG